MARRKIFGTAFKEDVSDAMFTLDGADVNVYQAGTMTPVDIYSSESGGTPLSQPIATDSAGYYEFWVETNLAVKVVITDGVDTITRDDINLGHGTEGSIKDHVDWDGASSPSTNDVPIWDGSKYSPSSIVFPLDHFNVVIDLDSSSDPQGDFRSAITTENVHSIAIIGDSIQTIHFDPMADFNQILISNVEDKYIWFQPGITLTVDMSTDPPIPPSDALGFFVFSASENIPYNWTFENMNITITSSGSDYGVFSFGQDPSVDGYTWLDHLLLKNCIFAGNDYTYSNMLLEVRPNNAVSGSTNTVNKVTLEDCVLEKFDRCVYDTVWENTYGVEFTECRNVVFEDCKDALGNDWWKKFNNSYELSVTNLIPSSPTLYPNKYSYLDADTIDGKHFDDFSVTVMESDTSPTVTDVNTIAFDQSDGFSVVDDGNGKVSVNLSGVASEFDNYVMVPSGSASTDTTNFTDIVDAIRVAGNNAKITWMPGNYEINLSGSDPEFDFGNTDVMMEGYGADKSSNFGASNDASTTLVKFSGTAGGPVLFIENMYVKNISFYRDSGYIKYFEGTDFSDFTLYLENVVLSGDSSNIGDVLFQNGGTKIIANDCVFNYCGFQNPFAVICEFNNCVFNGFDLIDIGSSTGSSPIFFKCDLIANSEGNSIVIRSSQDYYALDSCYIEDANIDFEITSFPAIMKDCICSNIIIKSAPTYSGKLKNVKASLRACTPDLGDNALIEGCDFSAVSTDSITFQLGNNSKIIDSNFDVGSGSIDIDAGQDCILEINGSISTIYCNDGCIIRPNVIDCSNDNYRVFDLKNDCTIEGGTILLGDLPQDVTQYLIYVDSTNNSNTKINGVRFKSVFTQNWTHTIAPDYNLFAISGSGAGKIWTNDCKFILDLGSYTTLTSGCAVRIVANSDQEYFYHNNLVFKAYANTDTSEAILLGANGKEHDGCHYAGNFVSDDFRIEEGAKSIVGCYIGGSVLKTGDFAQVTSNYISGYCMVGDDSQISGNNIQGVLYAGDRSTITGNRVDGDNGSGISIDVISGSSGASTVVSVNTTDNSINTSFDTVASNENY